MQRPTLRQKKFRIHDLKGNKSKQKAKLEPSSNQPSHRAISSMLDHTRNNQVIDSARNKGQTLKQTVSQLLFISRQKTRTRV